MKKIYSIILMMLIPLLCMSQEKIYKASLFGIRSTGTIDNTTSLQAAVDYISANGGGILEISVGRYLTGAVELKSGVHIRLREGAVIVGSPNIYTYKGHPGIFWAKDKKNILIEGKGVFEGAGDELMENIKEQQRLGHIPENQLVPSLLSFENCKTVVLNGLILRNSNISTPIRIVGDGVFEEKLSFE